MQENLYAIIGKDIFLVEKEVEKIIESFNVLPFNVITYDLEEENIYELIHELTTISLLSDSKVIKVRNPWFFYEQRDVDLKPLANYFKNPKKDTALIFMLNEDVNTNFLISKEAKKYLRFETVAELKEAELPEYVKEYFQKLNYIIYNDAVTELLNRVDNNYQLLHNELTKLELYGSDSKKITLDVVKLLVPRNLEDNLFELSSAVISKNKEKALKSYYDLLIRGVDPITIISNLANKLKETITTKHLLTKGLSQQSIADYFHVSNGRAYYMVVNANSQTFKFLENGYAALTDLDYKIKSGQIDKKLGLELWLLGGYNVKK